MNTYPNTPAPWSIGSNGASVKVMDADGKAVCMLTPRKGAWNGDLIAAAPDLLAALEMVDRIWRHDQTANVSPDSPLAIVRAAIAKATGETL